MAVNTKIIDKVVKNLIDENASLPYRHYVYDENTGKRYEVIVNQIQTKPIQFSESKLIKSAALDSVFGPRGQPCGCCGGSGKE